MVQPGELKQIKDVEVIGTAKSLDFRVLTENPYSRASLDRKSIERLKKEMDEWLSALKNTM